MILIIDDMMFMGAYDISDVIYWIMYLSEGALC